MTLDVWQGAEQEYVARLQPVLFFEALGQQGVYVFRPEENVPRAHLRNGGVCYVHSNLFEICTPECRDAYELVSYDKASEAYARLASWAFEERTGQMVHFYKTNIALNPKDYSQYTTVGAHENYLVERAKWSKREPLLVPYLVLRQIFCGVGGYFKGEYLISPRTIFPKKIYSETSTDYPIVSTRDEPHAAEVFYRVHVVNGEGARSEYTTFLKHSVTAYLLKAIQAGHIQNLPELDDPIQAGQKISRNFQGEWEIALSDGRSLKATDYMNSYYLEGIERVFQEFESKENDRLALKEFKWVLKKLDEGLIEALAESIEWVIKLRLIEEELHQNFNIEDGLDEKTAKEAATYQYTAVTDPLFDELVEKQSVRKVVSTSDVKKAFSHPPDGSRARLRLAIASQFAGKLQSLGWSSVKLKHGKSIISFPLPNLDGWTDDVISNTLAQISSLAEK